MENWTKRIFLGKRRIVRYLLSLCLVHIASGAAAEQVTPLIEPDVRPQAVDESLIDTENFELGLFTGMLSIEDFESSLLYGARLAYHLSESLMFEAHYGMAEAGETSFEKLGGVQVLSSDERDYSYYNFGIAYKLPGESYLSRHQTFNNNFYFSAGIGATEFADDTRLTTSFGVGYQLLLTDFLSVNITAKEHIFKIDLLGEEKVSFNTELSTGISFFF
jgi:outer membrane beta-barrel protein